MPAHGREREPTSEVLVALFFWRSLELEGGSGLIASVVRELRARGFAIHLLLPSRPESLDEDVRVTVYGRRQRIRTWWSYAIRLREECRRAGAVILLENNPLWHLAMAPLLARGTPTAVHISSPAIDARVFRHGFRKQYLAHWLGKSKLLARILALFVGFRATRYVVSTEHQARQLEGLGCPAKSIEVQPFGVDTERFRPRPAPARDAGSLVVGYLGHFSPIKGVPTLLGAFESAALVREGIRLRLAWSGKGQEADEVRSMLAASEHRDRIELLGRVDVPEFLSGLDVVVLPFRSESIPHLPLVLLEALAMGVPVITTRVGGLPGTIVDGVNGFLADSGDADAISRILIQLCDDLEVCNSLRARILSEAPTRFSTSAFCTALVSPLRPAERTGTAPGAPIGE
ncbi:MAG TPA: glycosyltransferase family 4 protein [Thermoanaerobaculia bacterium]